MYIIYNVFEKNRYTLILTSFEELYILYMNYIFFMRIMLILKRYHLLLTLIIYLSTNMSCLNLNCHMKW